MAMAISAARVAVDRRCVCVGDLRGSVASRAVGLSAVVLVVAGDACFGPWLRLQRDGGGVTLCAGDLYVCRVRKDHGACPWGMLGNRHLDGQRASGVELP